MCSCAEGIDEDYAQGFIDVTRPLKGLEHLGSPLLKIGDLSFTMIKYKCPKNFELFIDKCAAKYSKRMNKEHEITKTVLKTFLKDISGIGFSICRKNGTLRVDIAKWNRTCYRVQPGGNSSATGSIPFLDVEEVKEVPVMYRWFGMSSQMSDVHDLMDCGKRKERD